MSDKKIEKKTETREGKRPWEAGFAEEEYSQKQERLKEAGANPDALKNDRLLAEQTQKKS